MDRSKGLIWRQKLPTLLALTDGFMDSCFRRNDKKREWHDIFGVHLFGFVWHFHIFYSVIPAKAAIQERELLV
ncbi:MAG: hypothetical protein HQK95_04125 [Nitrospirae bacterium]|nr:hypothetical protein [Nitrospirota bacterium]